MLLLFVYFPKVPELRFMGLFCLALVRELYGLGFSKEGALCFTGPALILFLVVKLSLGLTESVNSFRLSFASPSRSILLMMAKRRLSLGNTADLMRNLFKLIESMYK